MQTRTSWDNLGNVYAGFDVNPNVATGNYIIPSGANITIKSATNILFEPGTIVDYSGFMDAYIAPYSGDCGPWIPIDKMAEIASTTSSSNDTIINIVPELGNDSVAIYPNPFANNIQVAFNISTDETSVRITLADVLGRLVFEKQEVLQSGYKNERINIDESASLYIVKVYISNQCNVKKLVKI